MSASSARSAIVSALAAQQGWSQAKQRTGGVACATSAAQAATIHASCLPLCITVAIPPRPPSSYAAGLDLVSEGAVSGVFFGLFDHSPGETLRGERPASLPSVKRIDCCGSLGDQGRVAEIPLSHLALPAGAQGCVDVQFKVKSEASGCLMLLNSSEDAHERLGSRELRWPGLITKPVAALLVGSIRQPDASPHAFQGARHFSGLPPGAVEQQNVLPRPVFSRCRRSLVRKRLTSRMEDPEILASRQGTSRPA